MDTGTLILLIALSLAAVAGTVSVFLLLHARSKRDDGQAIQEQRLRQLEEELRRSRMPLTTPSGAPKGPMPPDMGFPRPPGGTAPAAARGATDGASVGTAASSGSGFAPVASVAPSDPNRFENEPPLFADQVGTDASDGMGNARDGVPGEATPAAAPVNPDSATATSAEESPAAKSPTEKSSTEKSPSEKSPTEQSPAAESTGKKPSPSFRSVADIISPADESEVEWLADLTAGRRVTLHRLGYDVPEKMANLSASEVRRLAAATEVEPDLIRKRWIPAAKRHLESRHGLD